MTPKEILIKLTEITGDSRLSIPNLVLNVSRHDALAARLLLWLDENMWDGATNGDAIDVLNSATWWHTLLVSISGEEEEETE